MKLLQEHEVRTQLSLLRMAYTVLPDGMEKKLAETALDRLTVYCEAVEQRDRERRRHSIADRLIAAPPSPRGP